MQREVLVHRRDPRKTASELVQGLQVLGLGVLDHLELLAVSRRKMYLCSQLSALCERQDTRSQSVHVAGRVEGKIGHGSLPWVRAAIQLVCCSGYVLIWGSY